VRPLFLLLVAAVACDADDKACLLHSHCSSYDRCLEGVCTAAPEPVDVGTPEAGPVEAGPVDSGPDIDAGAASDAAADVGSPDAAAPLLDGSLVDGSPGDSNLLDGAATDLGLPSGDLGFVSDVSAADAGMLADALSPSVDAGP
jgi:hypothetical protein